MKPGKGTKRIGGLLLAMLLAGCSTSRLWTGSFRSTEAHALQGVPGLEGNVYLELVLGHFGPDLAGIVRFYRDPDFLQPVQEACPCQYLMEGRVDDGVLVFAFPSPYPCTTSPGMLLAARLVGSENGDLLAGPLGLDLDQAPAWTFTRRLEAADLTDRDRECTPEVDRMGVGVQDVVGDREVPE